MLGYDVQFDFDSVDRLDAFRAILPASIRWTDTPLDAGAGS
jgi:hypothetical protein